MSIFLFQGAKRMGWSLVVLSCAAGSCDGLTLIHVSAGYEIFNIPEPLAYTVLLSNGSAMIVPHSQPETGFQSSGVIAPRLPRMRVRMAPASCCVPYTQYGKELSVDR